MGALATVGTTGLMGTSTASESTRTNNDRKSSKTEILYSDENKRIVHYSDGQDFIIEINSGNSETNLKGQLNVKKANENRVSVSEDDSLKNKIEKEGSVEPQIDLPDWDDVWNPGYEFWTDIQGDCPAAQFEQDYTWGLAVDTGLPSLPGYASDKIESLALDSLCELVQGDLSSLSSIKSVPESSEAESLGSSSSTDVSAQRSLDPRQAIATVVAARSCKWALSPLVGVLANGAATGIWYDCHDPSEFSEFTAVCQTTASEYVTEAGEEGDGVPAVPGAHYGLEVEYWD
ncbi:hypothetical protein [Natrinema saccharevitans]|uniref:hypothetical protein n=1 Tax=Natrinema saccharevitans TaxID=301967 RepID=UPI001115A4B9|nr:hypothetical protein [Natrinema saccharevitans]